MALLPVDSLLSAARILDAASHKPSSASSVLQEPHFSEELELRDLLNAKMRIKRPSSASSEPYPTSRKNSSSKQNRFAAVQCFLILRTAHNELEKNRRANLRDCLEILKALVPDETDASKNTTLALLTRAHDHIESLNASCASATRDIATLESSISSLKQRISDLRAKSRQQTPALQASSPSHSLSTLSSACPSPTLPSYPSSQIDLVRDGLVPAFPLCYPSHVSYPNVHVSVLQALALPLPLNHLIV